MVDYAFCARKVRQIWQGIGKLASVQRKCNVPKCTVSSTSYFYFEVMSLCILLSIASLFLYSNLHASSFLCQEPSDRASDVQVCESYWVISECVRTGSHTLLLGENADTVRIFGNTDNIGFPTPFTLVPSCSPNHHDYTFSPSVNFDVPFSCHNDLISQDLFQCYLADLIVQF